MKIFTLCAALLAVALIGCKPRSFNTTSSANSEFAGEFELSNDPTPDKDFDELTLLSADAPDFVLSNDPTPDSDFL